MAISATPSARALSALSHLASLGSLTEAAEQTLFQLLDQHGQSGQRVVIGDTALLGLCEALDLPRRFYDQTMSGNRGFWVLVVPGVINSEYKTKVDQITHLNKLHDAQTSIAAARLMALHAAWQLDHICFELICPIFSRLNRFNFNFHLFSFYPT